MQDCLFDENYKYNEILSLECCKLAGFDACKVT